MQTIQLEVKDAYVENTLEILNGLKNIMIDKITLKYNDTQITNEKEYFNQLSHNSLEKSWDNNEDAIYDQFLK